MGPVSAKTYLAGRWSPASHRPKSQADYGRRGNTWVFGAFEPRTGRALTQCADRRDSANFIALLDAVQHQWPEGKLVLILDNLSTHKTLDVLLWALTHPRVHFLFQPTYAPWLNLIEPWWKTLRTLALKGRCFADSLAVHAAILAATAYWNDHAHPFTWHKANSF
jgi:hypothetical protein